MHGLEVGRSAPDSGARVEWLKRADRDTLRRSVDLIGFAAGASSVMVQVALRKFFNSLGRGQPVGELVPLTAEISQSISWVEHFTIGLAIVAILAGLLTVWRAPRGIALAALSLGIIGLAGIWYWRFFWSYV